MSKWFAPFYVGTLVGLITAKFLFVNSALALIPWSIAGLLLGMWCTGRKQAAARV